MRNEQELCTIFKNSVVNAGYLCEKIPDPSGNFNVSKRCFDGFGVWEDKPLYFEAKFLLTLESFNLGKIEDHQMEALLAFKKALPDSECWIVLGIKIPRKNRVYIFKNIEEINTRRKNKENFLKKELEKLPYYVVEKDLIDFNKLIVPPVEELIQKLKRSKK